MNTKRFPLFLAVAVLLAVNGQVFGRHVTHTVNPANISKQPFSFTVKVKAVGEVQEFEVIVKANSGCRAPILSATGEVVIAATGKKKAAFPPVDRIRSDGVQTYTFRLPPSDLDRARFTFTETPQEVRTPFPSPGDDWVFDLSEFAGDPRNKGETLPPASSADSTGANREEKEERITFPYFLPGSRIVVGEDLVDEANALDSKEDQIRFLIKILPPTDQETKHLSDRQLYAIRLLSLTDCNAVIDSLMRRFDFVHKGDGWPVVHAMARLGERSVEPLLERLQQVASDRQKTAACGAALIELKMDRFPKFIDELKRRKDIKLSEDLLNELLDQYRFAPDD